MSQLLQNVTFITNCDSTGFNVQIGTVNNVKEQAAKKTVSKNKIKGSQLTWNVIKPHRERKELQKMILTLTNPVSLRIILKKQ